MSGTFDEGASADVRAVLDAAALLDITEFDLFGLAYRRWHGRVAEARTLERCFAAYMFADRVPSWARHFARLVTDAAALGPVDAGCFGVVPRTRGEHAVSRAVRYMVAVTASLVALLVLGETAARVLKLGERCLFPPCY